MRKDVEVVVDCFEVLSQNLLWRTEGHEESH
jgi:hypothetical protein